jgi:Type VI immunity for VRR-NUC
MLVEKLAIMESETFLQSLIYREAGLVVMRPCLDITLYWSGSVFDRADDILSVYQLCLDALRGGIAFFRTETMTRARPLKSDTLDLLPFWLRRTKSRRAIYALTLEGGSTPDEPSDRAFVFNATATRGYLRLVLPTSFIARSVDPYLDLARNLAHIVSYDSGQAGFAVNWNHVGRNRMGVLRAMNSLGPRYPGLDMSYPFCTKYIVSNGIKCVNWLTFLCKEYCDRLGGLSALRGRFGDCIVVHDAKGGGAVIQAGPFPEIGDVNRQRNLPVYHHVGIQLAPIRCPEHPSLFGPRGLPDEVATDAWLGRFDS